MKKVGVVCFEGFEEAETITIVDLLRRMEIDTVLIGESEWVKGAHSITVKTDVLLDPSDRSYDLVVLPGGYGGVESMSKNEDLLRWLKNRNEKGMKLAAMCAAPVILEKVGALDGKDFTAYLGYDQIIKSGRFKEDIVVQDQNILTSRGPACAMDFAFAIGEWLGKDPNEIKKRIMYDFMKEA